ncbi:MAG: flagellar biosynthetic protein FliR [Cyanobacteriota bacterium]
MTHEIIKLLDQLPNFYDYYIAYMLVFARMIAFFQLAPIFKRKELVFMAKVGFSTILTLVILTIIDVGTIPQGQSFVYLLFINVVVGITIGFISRMIFHTVQAAGDLANNQMALSSASTFDPSTKVQTSIIGHIMSLFSVVVFIEIGGLHWVISAFKRSFDLFPLFDPTPQMMSQISLDYLITISGNIIFVGFQMVAPIIITTLAIDIILGIISKTAPQINVFQLSFVFKPCVGCMVLLATMPIFMRVLENYFIEYSQFF